MARGDQIYVYREFMNLKGVYQHHGIDCGDGTVIHYRKPSEIVEKTSFETFSRNNPVYVVQYTNGFCFIPDVVVSRAESRLAEQKYNLLFNNCEHFATWCKTGISESLQIKDFIPIIAHLKTVGLYDPLKEALVGADPSNARTLLQGALADIKVVWDDLQPQYKTALKEIDSWNKVATEALKQNRVDLAQKALERKVYYKKQANKLKDELDQLAIMAEKVIKDLLIANKIG
ncbi:NC domain-containing protein [Aphanothece hegewaldii CCALA 016]|uniref:NC domain-containing protein n=1 Tax=Aphanothece hegewaldii CCALA 016 TaxID=2107694 RepID=A0A2T1LZ39_9CHRO|nr:lecithin retinol acyltransferase family protein [Aphanothece hegewaldii]PSF37667.1 NC domain-containing protein [Aphanothece hegewaldii CCALA 016]